MFLHWLHWLWQERDPRASLNIISCAILGCSLFLQAESILVLDAVGHSIIERAQVGHSTVILLRTFPSLCFKCDLMLGLQTSYWIQMDAAPYIE